MFINNYMKITKTTSAVCKNVVVWGWALSLTGLGPKPHCMLCDLVPILGSLVSTQTPQDLI